MRIRALAIACLLSLLAGCGTPEAPEPAAAAAAAALFAAITDRDPQAPGPDGRTTASIWARICALCHADGTGGAPRFGNAQDWAPRLAQGEASLLAHTIEGRNQMPPLGYCMDCTREDFVHLIRFMTPKGAL